MKELKKRYESKISEIKSKFVEIQKVNQEL